MKKINSKKRLIAFFALCFALTQATAQRSIDPNVTPIRPTGENTTKITSQDNQQAQSLQSLSVAIACSTPSFAPAVTFSSGGTYAYTVATGDFNGDGKLDAVYANGGSNTVGVLLGNGNGSFAPATTFPSGGTTPYEIAVGDYNKDGNLDLAVVHSNSTNIGVFLGNGDGTFAPAVSYPAGGYGDSIASGDFNGDGKLDLVMAGNMANYIGVLLGNGNGTFAPVVTYPSDGTLPLGLVTSDFNGDGKLDVAFSNWLSNTISVMLGNGNGNLAAAVNYPSGGNGPLGLVSADFNGDNKADLVSVNQGSNTIAVMLGNGNGTFAPTSTYPVGSTGPTRLTTADYNGDGKADLASINQNSNDISVLLGNGNGTFTLPVTYPSGGSNPTGIASGDFNGDSKVDLVFTNNYSHNIGLLLNTCTAVTPSTPPTFLNDQTIVLDASKCGGDGNISVIPLSGTPPFQYSINGGATYIAGPNAGYTFQNLAAGMYQLRLKDGKGCESAVVTREVKTVYECPTCTPPTFLNDQTIVLDASCKGGDGNISIIPTSGTGPFMYSINGGATYVAGPNSGYTFMGLAAGMYQVRLMAGNGCESAIITREVKANAYGNCNTLSLLNPRLRSSAMDAASVQAYPNPSHGQFQVSLQGLASAKVQVEILDARASVVQTRQVNAQENCVVNINLQGKAKGLYLVRVVSDKGTQVQKVMVQ